MGVATERWITIKNWKDHNPRKDVEKSSWFRFEHKFVDNPKYEHFTCQDIAAWVALLSTASAGNVESFLLNVPRLAVRARVSPDEIEAALQLFIAEDFISITSRRRDGAVTSGVTPTCHYETKRNETDVREENNNTGEPAEVEVPPASSGADPEPPGDALDVAFDAVWKTYREHADGREGSKQLARERFRGHVGLKDLERFARAVTNYLADCGALGRYTKDLSTFIGTGSKRSPHHWQDWPYRAPAKPKGKNGEVPRAAACGKCSRGLLYAVQISNGQHAHVRCTCELGRSRGGDYPPWDGARYQLATAGDAGP